MSAGRTFCKGAKKRKAGIVVGLLGLSAAMSLGGAVAANALEGSFSTFVKQVQPGFDSRTWVDSGQTGDSTVIWLYGCKVNKGGEAFGSGVLKTVGITLFQNGRPVKRIDRGCGKYDFGNYGSGMYYFEISSINGNTSANRTTFLDADPVLVDY